MRSYSKWHCVKWIGYLVVSAILSGLTCRESPVFHLAILPGPAAGLLLLAQEQKLFAKAGLNIELHPYASVTEVQKALASGQIHLVAANLMEVMMIDGLQIQLVTAYAAGRYKLYARKDAGNSLEALKGARFGIEPNTFAEYLFLRAFNQKQLPARDFTLLNISSDHIVEALIASEIQAAFTSGAAALLLDTRDDMQVLLSASDFPKEVLDVIAVSRLASGSLPRLEEALRTLWDSTLEAHRTQPLRAKQLLDQLPTFKNLVGLENYKLVGGSEQGEYFSKDGILSQVLTRLEAISPTPQPLTREHRLLMLPNP